MSVYTDLTSEFDYKDLLTWQNMDKLAENDNFLYEVLTGADSTQILHDLGSASLPGYSFVGDPNTGMYSASADQLNFATGGSLRALINSSGYLGVGVSDPQYVLSAGSDTNSGLIEARTDGADIGGAGGANLARVAGAYQDNPIPGSAIHFSAQGSGGQRGAIGFLTKTADDDSTQPDLKMVITQTGRVGIGVTSPSYNFEVSGTQAYLSSSGSNTELMTQTSSGTITGGVQALTSGQVRLGSITAHDTQLVYNNTVVATLISGIQVGAPTGGDKGAGTINAAGDIYKNNSAYTNPDYVLEKYYRGSIVKFKQNDRAAIYTGMLPIDKLESYMKEFLDLPGVKTLDDEGQPEAQGVFERTDISLEKIEEAFIYITELHNRVKALENKER